jgi:hypothetical protein
MFTTHLLPLGGYSAIRNIDYYPPTGGFVVFAQTRTSADILRVHRTPGLYSTLVPNSGVGSNSLLRTHPWNGNVYHGNEALVDVYDSSGTHLRRCLYQPPFNSPPPVTIYHFGLTLDRSRHLAGEGRASPGGRYSLRLSFPYSPGAPYQIFASRGLRPGIALPGAHLYLEPDDLFTLSITGSPIFSGFSGTLDTQGVATASVNIPPIPSLVGRRIFFSVLAWDPARGGLQVSRSIGMTIRP